MDSILANIFLAVRDRLATSDDLKFIDQDMGQLEIDELGERASPVKFPCALVDIADIRYTDNSEDSQLAEAVIEVRIGLTAYTAATHYYQHDIHKQNALAYLNLEHKINQLLHGWSDENYFNPLSRVASSTEKRKDNIRVRVLRYSFGFTDDTAMEVAASSIARPDLELDVS